jgi:hypothetical protein
LLSNMRPVQGVYGLLEDCCLLYRHCTKFVLYISYNIDTYITYAPVSGSRFACVRDDYCCSCVFQSFNIAPGSRFYIPLSTVVCRLTYRSTYGSHLFWLGVLACALWHFYWHMITIHSRSQSLLLGPRQSKNGSHSCSLPAFGRP